jgi:hypothetical protein
VLRILPCLALLACAGTWGDRGLTATYAASSALVACDAGQTIWASDRGAWDRRAADGVPLMERNPVLGRTPGPDMLAGIALANAVGGYALLQSSAPRWLKWLWFGGVAAAEAYVVRDNATSAGLGMCGLGGQDQRITASARVAR